MEDSKLKEAMLENKVASLEKVIETIRCEFDAKLKEFKLEYATKMKEIETKQIIQGNDYIEVKVTLNNIVGTLNGIVSDVKTLTTAPAKRWESTVTAIIVAAIGIISTCVLIAFGIKK